MDRRTEIREFLSSRRAKVQPADVGLPDYGPRRRVLGLRREEVALLAGVSVDYYTRIERGSLAGVSDVILRSIADALRLDDVERSHLADLARSGRPLQKPRKRPTGGVRDSLRQIVDGFATPAVLQNQRHDILAANAPATALYAEVIDGPADGNYARFIFLDDRSRDFYADWDRIASENVAMLRTEAGRDPFDKALTALVGELSTRSEDFRRRWASHDVHVHRTGVKRVHHPLVGELELGYERLDVSSDEGLALFVYVAQADSPTADALTLLAALPAGSASREAPSDVSR